jgi:prophage antirepressor-like protein
MPDLIQFAYENYPIRTMPHVDGSTWWALTDVCVPLGIRNPSQAAERLKESEKDTLCLIDSVGRPHEILLVNEPGLYRLIMRSRKKEAETFQHWVFHEVLPQIRKTGSYGQPPTPAVINPEHQLMIDMIVPSNGPKKLRLPRPGPRAKLTWLSLMPAR